MMDRPILFSSAMVEAILQGRKTQTRRVIKMRDGSLCEDDDIPAYDPAEGQVRANYVMDFSKTFPQWRRLDCPYGQAGDRLWVRETWRCEERGEYGVDGVHYRADDAFIVIKNTREASDAWGDAYRDGELWRPSIFMPRWASRITLEIVSVRVERVQEISEEDAGAEGMEVPTCTHREEFEDLWNKINKKRGFGWEVNPWVWVVEFKRVDAPLSAPLSAGAQTSPQIGERNLGGEDGRDE